MYWPKAPFSGVDSWGLILLPSNLVFRACLPWWNLISTVYSCGTWYDLDYFLILLKDCCHIEPSVPTCHPELSLYSHTIYPPPLLTHTHTTHTPHFLNYKFFIMVRINQYLLLYNIAKASAISFPCVQNLVKPCMHLRPSPRVNDTF